LLRQGASGYLNKDCDPEEIVKAIRTVHRGRKYISAGVAERLAAGLGGGGDKPPHETLSERELQVFLRLAKGETIGHMAPSGTLRAAGLTGALDRQAQQAVTAGARKSVDTFGRSPWRRQSRNRTKPRR
jgi:hypothetical protein